MASRSYVLLVEEGPRVGQRALVERREFVVGREPGCDMVIQDLEVSRRHFRLVAQDGGYAIEDLGSTNGTFVNDQRIRSLLPLLPGAGIRLGEKVQLSFEEETVPEDEANTGMMELPAEEPPLESAPPAEAAPAMAAAPSQAEPLPPAPEARELPKADAVVAPAEPQSRIERLRAKRRMGEDELPFFQRPMVIGIGAVLILGICAISAFLWYVDANFLWCDVFGGLISACQ